MFAATQALGWALFSSSLVCLIHLAIQAAQGMAYCIRCWVYATGSVMLASQIVRPPLPVNCCSTRCRVPGHAGHANAVILLASCIVHASAIVKVHARANRRR